MKTRVKTKKQGKTIGLDLGDRKHTYCVLGKGSDPEKEGEVGNSREALTMWAREYPGALVVMEAGTHSPWASRHLKSLGLRVVVANPRKTRAIWKDERKCDRRDAMMLARLARSDIKLLSPIKHGSEEYQRDMLHHVDTWVSREDCLKGSPSGRDERERASQIKLRDNLVRTQVSMINAVRSTLRSLGYQVSSPSTARFHKTVMDEVPAEMAEMIAPSVALIAETVGNRLSQTSSTGAWERSPSWSSISVLPCLAKSQTLNTELPSTRQPNALSFLPSIRLYSC